MSITPEEPFPSTDISSFFINVLCVLLMYGSAYLANTGAMLFGKWIPEKTGIQVIVIDGGRNYSDGHRLLGDGKSWNGLIGGGIVSGLLFMLAHKLWNSNGANAPLVDPLLYADSNDWFWLIESDNSGLIAAFTMGFVLGFACMVGDMCGSFIKRRRGLKREGDQSSEAPLLDTIPFAIAIFITSFILFDGQIITHHNLVEEILFLLLVTPLIHRLFNVIGYKFGLKDVPY
ncbi:MAG: CDP-archaeol synthase [Candidatus Poseidoniales archaeon]|jgi:CDP-2,3-bis-(O-geranylgeranyl)-sn-glycerol synthase|tara:strand:+ start:1223 stop:1915 length:693 start_codon:yes stop_codon:yes gene_type:complete